MSNYIRTPKYYRKLKHGEKRRANDMVWADGIGPWKTLKTDYPNVIGHKYFPRLPHKHFAVIRLK